jgi:hypothetical protein
MAVAMFRVKQWQEGVWRGSKGGLGRAGAAIARAGLGLTAVAIAACSSSDGIAAQAGSSVTEALTPPAPPAAPVPGKADFADNAEQGEAKRDFAYSWPAEVSAVPALAQRFTAERDTLLADQKADWAESLREFADQDCGGCVNRSFEKSWDVVADLPRFLSLSASFYEYSGGAHGNGAFDALVWDREAQTAFDPKAMFRSEAALQDALGAAWCKALKAERSQRLGEEYSDDGFFQCPPVADLTVLVGSSDKQRFNRIGLLAAPYVAGSYAEGSYEVTLPVTPAVLAAVKPEYKAAFALGK